jgi:hypothetical protein
VLTPSKLVFRKHIAAKVIEQQEHEAALEAQRLVQCQNGISTVSVQVQ